MEKFGDFFPGAENLEDVVRMMAERAAAAEAMFNSLSAEQQGELRAMFAQMMENMELNFSMNRLVSNLRHGDARHRLESRPSHARRRRFALRPGRLGRRTAGPAEGTRGVPRPGHAAQGLPEVDVEAVRRNLGDDAARHVVRLQKALQGLKDQGFVDRQGNQLQLTPKGIRKIGQIALKDLFNQLRDSPTLGMHRVATLSRGGDREETSKPWEPGEPFSLHLPKTMRNALLRQGPGTPVQAARR